MKKLPLLLIIVGLAISSCQPKQEPKASGPVQHVEWSRRGVIYEVNIRQYTPEGTFKAFEKELPRLQKMGADILWLMPVNPLGRKNRKGSLGSYYAVSDYLAVNPEYGTQQDFTDLVKKAHELGLKVILDWVANHTAWDNPLITQHPDWYLKDSTGQIISPNKDWWDVAALDYSKPGLRKYMTDALTYWIREADIDGYRCDVAGMMPVSFWNEAITELQKIKPLFMLAEEEKPKMHDTGRFDATYSGQIFRIMNDIAGGKATADRIDTLLSKEAVEYPEDAYRMRFTSNHDENSWSGTEYERLGEGAKAFAVLSFTIPGIPLIYSGQEAAMKKRLRFFDKDTIPWNNYPLESFYTTLTGLKKKNKLIAAGADGGEFVKVATTNDRAVYAFLRKKPHRQMFVVLNLSPAAQEVRLQGDRFEGSYTEAFTGVSRDFVKDDHVRLGPWGYQVFTTR